MKTIILLKGLPASGKSTFARELLDSRPGEYVRVNKDELRSTLHNGKWTKFNEKQILRIRDQIIETALQDGKSVIVDDTNLAPKHQARMEQLAKKHEVNLDVYDVFLEVSVEECIKRDLKRANSVGQKVIMDIYKQFLAPKRESKELNPFIFDESLPTCVIFDLDGTLSCMGDRSPYNGEQCEVDTPNESIIELLKMTQYYDSNPNIQTIIFSGRNSEAISQTMDWLIENEVDFDELHMRNPGDQRKDSVVKREMFDEFIKDKYNVLFVVDDRDQVVEMWRSMGLTCLQVNYGDF